MVGGNRSKKSIEENLRSTEYRVQELMNSHYQLQKTVEEMGVKFGQLQSTVEMMLAEFQSEMKGKTPKTSTEISPETIQYSPRQDEGHLNTISNLGNNHNKFGESYFNKDLAEFSRLQQITTISHYQKRFEFLRSLVEYENPGLTEEYFVKCFVDGLKEEIGEFVKVLKPKKLSEAISIARVKEFTVDASFKRTKLPLNSLSPVNNVFQNEFSVVGRKKSLQFFEKNETVTELETKWVMEEYRLGSAVDKPNKVDDIALCKIYNTDYFKKPEFLLGPTFTPTDGEIILKCLKKRVEAQLSPTNLIKDVYDVFSCSPDKLFSKYKIKAEEERYFLNPLKRCSHVKCIARNEFSDVNGRGTMVGRKIPNTLRKYEDKVKEVWGINSSKNVRNKNWIYFEMVGNIEVYNANMVRVHVSVMRNPFELLFGQKQVFSVLYNSLYMEMGLPQLMTCNGNGLYSIQWLSITNVASFVFDPGGLW